MRRHPYLPQYPSAWAVFIAALIVVAPRTGLAQTSLQIPLQFDFLNPGAKSLAVGGAFAGLADDATATFANPAGLTQLGASEVSIEFRGSWVTTQFLQAGRLSGPSPTKATTRSPARCSATARDRISAWGSWPVCTRTRRTAGSSPATGTSWRVSIRGFWRTACFKRTVRLV